MGFSVGALIMAATAAYTSDQQRKSAHEQADIMAEQGRQASEQAAEAARGNALAAQTASEHEKAQLQAKANADLAAPQDTAQVQLATQAPDEVARRRTVRASFDTSTDGAGAEGSIRL